jgi:hypothetical protein
MVGFLEYFTVFEGSPIGRFLGFCMTLKDVYSIGIVRWWHHSIRYEFHFVPCEIWRWATRYNVSEDLGLGQSHWPALVKLRSRHISVRIHFCSRTFFFLIHSFCLWVHRYTSFAWRLNSSFTFIMKHHHLLFACALPFLFPASLFAERTTQALLNEGNAYLTSGKLHNALTSYDAAICK